MTPSSRVTGTGSAARPARRPRAVVRLPADRDSVCWCLASATTVFLVVYAAILILGIGIPLGGHSALRRRVGSVVTVGTAVGMATPAFVAAIVLITVFAVQARMVPRVRAGDGFVDRLWHLTLPAIALALAWVAYVTQITKAAVREEMTREHVETARSRGIPWPLVVRRHVLRNALIPITTVAGLTVAGLIAGAVVVEQAFGLNGLGSFLVQAAAQKDFAVVQAISLLLVVATFVIANAVVDLLNGILDPRLRREEGTDDGHRRSQLLAATGARSRRARRIDWVIARLRRVHRLIVVVAILAPVLAPYDPDQVDILGPTRVLGDSIYSGTDSLGRDLLSRLMYGARLSLFGPALIVFIATVVGTAGRWLRPGSGGWFDGVTSRVWISSSPSPG